MAATVHLCSNLHTRIFTAHIQCAYPFGAVHFVCRKCHDVYTYFTGINRNLTHHLCSIAHKQDSVTGADIANFLHRLNDPRFVVGPHDRYQNRGRLDSRF